MRLVHPHRHHEVPRTSTPVPRDWGVHVRARLVQGDDIVQQVPSEERGAELAATGETRGVMGERSGETFSVGDRVLLNSTVLIEFRGKAGTVEEVQAPDGLEVRVRIDGGPLVWFYACQLLSEHPSTVEPGTSEAPPDSYTEHTCSWSSADVLDFRCKGCLGWLHTGQFDELLRDRLDWARRSERDSMSSGARTSDGLPPIENAQALVDGLVERNTPPRGDRRYLWSRTNEALPDPRAVALIMLDAGAGDMPEPWREVTLFLLREALARTGLAELAMHDARTETPKTSGDDHGADVGHAPSVPTTTPARVPEEAGTSPRIETPCSNCDGKGAFVCPVDGARWPCKQCNGGGTALRSEAARPTLGLSFSWDTVDGEIAYSEETEEWTLDGAVEGRMSSPLARQVLAKLVAPDVGDEVECRERTCSDLRSLCDNLEERAEKAERELIEEREVLRIERESGDGMGQALAEYQAELAALRKVAEAAKELVDAADPHCGIDDIVNSRFVRALRECLAKATNQKGNGQ